MVITVNNTKYWLKQILFSQNNVNSLPYFELRVVKILSGSSKDDYVLSELRADNISIKNYNLQMLLNTYPSLQTTIDNCLITAEEVVQAHIGE